MLVSIIGIGLIGGSLAKSLRETGFATKIWGIDNNQEHSTKALALGIVDEMVSLEMALAHSNLMLIAIPVDKAPTLLTNILNQVNNTCIVADMGSTKQGICSQVANHPQRAQFVATHPIAGTEYSGPEAAISDLFKGKKTIICDQQLSAPTALTCIQNMYKILEMDIIYMPADKHDKHIAFVSHLSHISSFALGLTVLDIEKDERNIFNMAGSGFSSTVRLAKSSPTTWAPILMQNAESVSFALDQYITHLENFRQSLKDGNSQKLSDLMESANDIKRIIN